ncbi:MAG: sugar phosphate isomerase/epimerase [Oscillospiraceae bacterium]|nr:sugar phosphate isomerase/epimerase [Oscillospiraceae bacterium]
MRFSFMSFSCPEADIGEFIGIAKKYGYDGIEPRICAGHKHGIEPTADKQYLRDIQKKAAEAEIDICCVATSCEFANHETVEDNITRAKQAIDLSAELGAPVIRVFGGTIPSGMDREKSFDSIVGALLKLSDYAAAHQTVICLETHDDWSDPEWVAKIMRGVSHRFIAVNWDIMHPALSAGCTIQEAFHKLKQWIRHVHVHDGVHDGKRLNFMPVGEGGVDHAAALTLLKDYKYDAYISGEWIGWEPYDIHLPREIANLKSLIR